MCFTRPCSVPCLVSYPNQRTRPRLSSPGTQSHIDPGAIQRELPETLVERVACLGLDPRGHAAVQLPHENPKGVDLDQGMARGGAIQEDTGGQATIKACVLRREVSDHRRS